jgi:hypothetical protein
MLRTMWVSICAALILIAAMIPPAILIIERVLH